MGTTIRVNSKELINGGARLRVTGRDHTGALRTAYLTPGHDLSIRWGSLVTYTDFVPESAFFHKLVKVEA